MTIDTKYMQMDLFNYTPPVFNTNVTTGWTMPAIFNFDLPVFTNWTMPSFNFLNFDFNNFNFPQFTFNTTPNFQFNFDSGSLNSPKFNFTASNINKTNFTFKKAVSGNVDNSYLTLTKSAAYQKALSDTNLEKLSGGKNWEVAESSFITDIPFAKKGTGAILDKVGGLIGEKLVITSALGTGEANNPHAKGGYASHHNAENPKLDIRINGNGQELAQKLRNTGYFSRVSIESDHLDVQIDPEKFKSFEAVA